MTHNEILVCCGIIFTAFILITIIGNEVVKLSLPKGGSASTPNGNGAKIGNLERILYMIGIISQNWSLIAIVLGLKTIARYKKLEEQVFSEYFLIGSLVSLVYSIIISVSFLYFIHFNNCTWLENKLINIQTIKITNN